MQIRTRIPIGKIAKPVLKNLTSIEVVCDPRDRCIETIYYDVNSNREMCRDTAFNGFLRPNKKELSELQKKIPTLQAKCSKAEQSNEIAREAQESRDRTANACNGLYVGKPVSYTLRGECLFNCKKRGVITGIGSGVIGVRSSEDGEVREKLCTELD